MMYSLNIVPIVLCIAKFDYFAHCDEEPLIVTSYLESGKIKEAQEKSLVVPDIDRIKSYTGFFTVNKTCNTNLFFWFIPAQNNWETAPVLLWLNGGPGCSSLLGMFVEMGPFNFLKKERYVQNKYHWAINNNVIFLDQPAGTGFSFTKDGCYADTLASASEEAYYGLVQFFKLFPKLQKNRFFITGESFGGHSIPALACEIDKQNPEASLKINLQGVVIGNPYIDERCHHTGEFLYTTGIADEQTRDEIVRYEEKLSKLITEQNYTGAINVSRELFGGPLDKFKIPSRYNILYDKEYSEEFKLYVRDIKTRKQLHVGYVAYNVFSNIVYDKMEDDMYMPSTPYVEHLLQSNKYIVGFYSGQLDIACLYTSLPCVLRQLIWEGTPDYLSANRSLWYVGDRLAGWFKTSGNLFEVVVRDSGHLVPADQPLAALELITAAVADKPGTKLLTKLQTEPKYATN